MSSLASYQSTSTLNTVTSTSNLSMSGNISPVSTTSAAQASSVTIHITHKSKRYTVTVPSTGVTESKLFSTLTIPPWIHRNLEIISLKRVSDEQDYVSDTESGSTMSMEMDSYRESAKEHVTVPLEILPHTNGQIKALRQVQMLIPGATYQLVMSDHSVNYSEQLTDEERNAIRQRFNEMDLDGNGTVTREEIHRYYANITERKKQALRDKLDQMLRRRKRSSIDLMWKQAVENLERLQEFAIKQFMQHDQDQSMDISYEEFLKGEARILIISRQHDGES